ncbi:MAG TPA: carboxypeptidase-like regulatory domain-containing protein [Terriglobia bacterium]|nr:carboxypeptidase-like regulatory domain-containing protein [Terriglobia bacterium]
MRAALKTFLISACLPVLSMAQSGPPIPKPFLEGGLRLTPARNPPDPLPAAISGVIRDRDTRAPVAGATVTLTRANGIMTIVALLEERTPPGPIPPVTTDEFGRFSFEGIYPDSYRLKASRAGYVPTEWERERDRPEAIVALRAGEFRQDLELTMARTAGIRGYVRDNDGRPLVGISVQAFGDGIRVHGPGVPDLTEPGSGSLRLIGEATSDERGEYHINELPAGPYVFAAGSALGAPESRSARTSDFAFSAYPESDWNNGARATVRPGDDLNLDFSLKPERRRQIRGMVVDQTGLGSIAELGISLEFRSPIGRFLRATGASASYEPEHETFTVSDALPGTYVISVIAIFREGTIPARGTLRFVAGSATVVVGDADVDNVIVTLSATKPGPADLK